MGRSPKQISCFSKEQIQALTREQIQALTKEQIWVINEQKLPYFKVNELNLKTKFNQKLLNWDINFINCHCESNIVNPLLKFKF